MTPAELVARILDTADRTGDLDWSLVREDFEIYDHELPDSSVHRGREGWHEWLTDWQQAFDDYSVERFGRVEVDEVRRMMTAAARQNAPALLPMGTRASVLRFHAACTSPVSAKAAARALR